MCGFVIIYNPSIIGVACRLNFFLTLVRCRTSYLLGANFTPWVSTYRIYLSWVSLSTLQFRSVKCLYVRIFTSSTNPNTNIRNLSLFTVLSRSTLKKRKSIRDTRDP
jgi:hypothetical protein